MRLVIVGMGDIGWELVRELSQRGAHEVVVIDRDRDRCDEVSNSFDALVLRGDGTDPELLQKAQIDQADALVATTDSDAINTVIAMLGRHFAVDTIVVKLKQLGLRAACHQLGVTRIIAPSISASAEILGTLMGFHRLDFSVVARGGLRLVDVEVQAVGGKQLAELHFPDGALVVAVLRSEHVLLPRGGTVIERGDVLLTLVESDAALEKVSALLSTS